MRSCFNCRCVEVCKRWRNKTMIDALDVVCKTVADELKTNVRELQDTLLEVIAKFMGSRCNNFIPEEEESASDD